MTEIQATVEYRDIPGHPGYRAGSDGSIWSARKRKSLGGRSGTTSIIGDTWRRLKPKTASPGYPLLNLRGCTVRVHTLILLAFVGPRPKGMQACHNDGCKTNNVPSNLRWGTAQSNMLDRNHHGTHNKGERNGMRKLTAAMVKEIRERYAAVRKVKKIAPRGFMVKLAAEYGISRPYVDQIIHDDLWRDVRPDRASISPSPA